MPNNSFYNDFDKACINDRAKDTYRSEFEVDRDRVLHTRAFRRLQSKTQVFIPGEYDFYRTRLTHSLEVAQIGRSICNFLNRRSDEMEECSYYIDPDIVEAACLTHDIGNPPFGHAGEAALNDLMKDFGGFEGNAQSARIINNLIFSDDYNRRGMEPSRGFLDSILKYKRLRNEGWKSKTPPGNHFIYDYQENLLQFVFGEKYEEFSALEPLQKNNVRSIECRIMDHADDIANAAADVVDGIKARFITTADINNYYEKEFDGNDAVKEARDILIKRIEQGRISVWSGQTIGSFISACRLEKDKNFMSDISDRYRFKLKVPQEKLEVIRFLKGIAIEMVFRTPKIEQLEFKGRKIIEKLFNTYKEIYIDTKGSSNILPSNYVAWVKEAPNAEDKYRIICDYIAGMTDSFIIRIYERLFIPNSGSISDII